MATEQNVHLLTIRRVVQNAMARVDLHHDDDVTVRIADLRDVRAHAAAIAEQLAEAEGRYSAIREYARECEATVWRISRGPLGKDWATERTVKDRAAFGVIELMGDLPEEEANDGE